MAYETRPQPQPQPRNVTGWVGWVWFAGIIMILSGLFNAITGMYAVIYGDIYVQTARRLLLFDLTGWGWLHLAFGILLIVTGVALTMGQTWARIAAVIIVMLNALSQLMWIAINPWWSLTVIAVDVLVLYALIVHGGESREARV
ncbi:DUF7144 family membrane protein [Nonomuraea cavernae]|uniref:Membrane protein n=1 Tax=Nonomuraea cavernae TaxID=2045107 RepID=A0A917YSG2_9ACTN|nr:hypothetical protein [Nonomuraea cavernae]MCA2184744.1 hypothetical protein [Nonomuraea cavernae]GGO62880.1 membrane protein [Nonomuraea cavernae]